METTPWWQGCRWTLFNWHRRHSGKMILTERETSKIKTLNPCPLAALMFLSFFFFNLHFDTLFHKSLHEFFIFFWKSAFASLPSTTASKIQTTLVGDSSRFCWESTNLHSSFLLILSQLSGITSVWHLTFFVPLRTVNSLRVIVARVHSARKDETREENRYELQSHHHFCLPLPSLFFRHNFALY